MKVIILGAGIIGVTTAYILGTRGYEVEVIDRQPDAASETSFANGGQLSYSHAEPWANPAVLPKIFKWMFDPDAPLVLRPRMEPAMISWGIKFLMNCSQIKSEQNAVNTLRLGIYSKRKMDQIRTITGIQFDHVRDGILHVFTKKSDLDYAVHQAKFQERFGCPADILDPQGCIRVEPTLEHSSTPIIGGIHQTLDESGDIMQFTRALTKICEKEFKTKFSYNTNINAINTDGVRITSVSSDHGIHKADSYIMSMGSYSTIYLNKIGIRVPIYPMKGYSVTIPANFYTPKMSITDTEHKIVFSRLGERLRVAGTAEFAGYNSDVKESRILPIVRASKHLFPKCDFENIELKWACLRPSTPDGPPIIGKTKYPNLFLNTGHGTLGWTQAAGSAFLVADIMENKNTEISLTGLTVDRYK